METDVVPICRVCLETLKDEYIDMESSFFFDHTQASKNVSSTTAELESNDSKNLTYMDCFRECTHLNVEIDGHCTQGICVPCSLDLRLAYEFLKKAETAAEYYEKYMKKSLKKFQDEQMLNHEYSMVETVLEESDEKLVTDGLSEIEEFPLSETQNDEDDIDIFEAKYRASEKDNEQSGTEALLEVTTIDIDKIKKEHANKEEHTITPISKEITLVGNATKPKGKRLKTSKLSEEKHKNRKSAPNKDNYPCNLCSVTYSSKHRLTEQLKYHMRKQLNIKSDACKTCGKTFVNSSYLRKHVQQLHKNEIELHECDQCGKIYRQKSSLDSHKILHSSEAPKCLECGKKFSRPFQLQIHMRFHTQDFPFVCEVCGRKFAIKSHLRTHMWRHEGLKFECQDCGKLFETSSSLLEHSFKHTEMPFQCCYCPKGYPSKQKFRVHLKTAHSIELNEEELRKVTRVIAKQPAVRRKHILVQVDHQENE